MGKELLGNLELNRIYQRDVVDGLKMIPDNSVDLIVADPPYFKVKKENWDNQWETIEEFKVWINSIFNDFYRVLKDNGSLYVWGQPSITSHFKILLEERFNFNNWIVWEKEFGRRGHSKFAQLHEDLLWVSKGKKPTFNWQEVSEPATRAGAKEGDTRVLSDIWKAHRWNNVCKERVGHPTQKPLQFCERIIKASSNINDIVLIPFVGSGSECVSAK